MEAENLEPTGEQSGDNSGEPNQDAGTQDWKSEFGIEGETFDKFQSPADLANAYTEMEAYRGNSVRIPSENAGAEDWNEFDEKLGKRVSGLVRLPAEDDKDGWNNFYNRMGRPTAPEHYQFDTPEGVETDVESEMAFKKFVYEQGLTAHQAKGLHDYLISNISEAEADLQKTAEANFNELKADWGAKYDHNVKQAQNMANVLNDKMPGLLDYFDQQQAQGNDAMMVKLMYEFSQLAGESGAIQLEPTAVMSPDEARMQIAEMRRAAEADKNHPLYNDMHPDHQAMNKRMRELYSFANPS